MLARDRGNITGATGKDHKVRQTHETKVEVVNATELLFQVFLRSHFKSPTKGKYWEALDRVLKVGN